MNFVGDSYEDLNNEDNIFPDQNSDPFDSINFNNDINSVFVGNNNLYKEMNNSILKENNNNNTNPFEDWNNNNIENNDNEKFNVDQKFPKKNSKPKNKKKRLFKSLRKNYLNYLLKNGESISKNNLQNTITKNTSSLLNKKTKRDSNFINYKKCSNIKQNKKNKIFNSSRRGRNKKGSDRKGKHTKYDKDNMFRSIKSLNFKVIKEQINSYIENIKNSELNNFKDNFGKIHLLLIENKQAINSAKKFNKVLLNKTIGEIFSVKISGRNYKDKNFNKNLINKLYELNENGNQIDEKIKIVVTFLKMRYKDFWSLLTLYIKYKKYFTTINILNEIDDDYIFIKELIKIFPDKVEEYLKNKKESETYNEIFRCLIEDFHQRFDE